MVNSVLSQSELFVLWIKDSNSWETKSQTRRNVIYITSHRVMFICGIPCSIHQCLNRTNETPRSPVSYNCAEMIPLVSRLTLSLCRCTRCVPRVPEHECVRKEAPLRYTFAYRVYAHVQHELPIDR